MPRYTLQINGRRHDVEAEADDSLLSILRYDLGLTGSKYGCGEGQCGACTVHIGGQATRSCITRVGAVAGKPVVTIEGVSGDDGAAGGGGANRNDSSRGANSSDSATNGGAANGDAVTLHPVQEAFIEAEAFQCGYCTPGMVMATIGLLQTTPNPSDRDIARLLNGNVCRCGTYSRIVSAVRLAADRTRSQSRPSAAAANAANPGSKR